MSVDSSPDSVAVRRMSMEIGVTGTRIDTLILLQPILMDVLPVLVNFSEHITTKNVINTLDCVLLIDSSMEKTVINVCQNSTRTF